jgi:hypothetical protein
LRGWALLSWGGVAFLLLCGFYGTPWCVGSIFGGLGLVVGVGIGVAWDTAVAGGRGLLGCWWEGVGLVVVTSFTFFGMCLGSLLGRDKSPGWGRLSYGSVR